jgi:PleD family two-component response regulator
MFDRSGSAEACEPHAGRRLSRVLVVDDDPDLRDVVAAMLEVVGLETTAVASAEEALSRAHLQPAPPRAPPDGVTSGGFRPRRARGA